MQADYRQVCLNKMNARHHAHMGLSRLKYPRMNYVITQYILTDN